MTQPAIKRASFEDLIEISGDRPLEIIDGQIVEKEAARFEHSCAQRGMASWTGMLFHRKPEGPTGGWWIGTEAEVGYSSGDVYLHDLAGWRRDRVPQMPSGRPVMAVPDWVCEITSPTNWRHDTVVKFDTCFRHRVNHFWIVNVEHRVLTVYRWHPEGWLRLLAVEPGQRARLEPFDAVEFEVSALFGDDPGPEPAKIVG